MKIFGKKKSSPESNKQFYDVKEFSEPSNIPLKEETERQISMLGKGNAYGAMKESYKKFDLSLDICYELKDGKLILKANSYSQKDALKMIEDKKQKEAIKKALNIEF